MHIKYSFDFNGGKLNFTRIFELVSLQSFQMNYLLMQYILILLCNVKLKATHKKYKV